MNPSNPWFLAAFGGVIILYHLDLIISLLNLAQFAKPLPEAMRPLYDPDTLLRTQDYHRQTTQLDLAQATTQLAILLTFWLAGGRMKPGKKGDPNSYKVRRAKVGGYKDYFDEGEAAEIDEYVRKELSPAFGYDAPTRA